MNPLKRMYSSGIQKGAEESRKLRFLLSVLLPSICSLRCKPQVLIFLQLQMFVENADIAEEEADRLIGITLLRCADNFQVENRRH